MSFCLRQNSRLQSNLVFRDKYDISQCYLLISEETDGTCPAVCGYEVEKEERFIFLSCAR